MPVPAHHTSPGRTLRALELAVEGRLTASGLANELAVDARTARQLLGRLVREEALVRRDGRWPTYEAGPRLQRLAWALLERGDEDDARGPSIPRAAVR